MERKGRVTENGIDKLRVSTNGRRFGGCRAKARRKQERVRNETTALCEDTVIVEFGAD
jgi:hypothetical protein